MQRGEELISRYHPNSIAEPAILTASIKALTSNAVKTSRSTIAFERATQG